MRNVLEQSDGQFLDELHRLGPGTVQDIGTRLGVTATAIRLRLTRLQGFGFVVRQLVRKGRGRPHYIYKVTEKGLRQLGDNYGDLALILWREMTRISDPIVRREVTDRVRDALVARFGHVEGATIGERMRKLRDLLLDRGYDVELSQSGSLPVLRENNCPYQEIADQDRGICEMEQEVFQRVLGSDVKLATCCLDGHHCCEFSVSEPVEQAAAPVA
jgi:predicted ArsR family transcriptional regulator